MKDYKQKYYKAAVRIVENLTFLYKSQENQVIEYLQRYFPKAKKEELHHALNWALADTWGGGCEVEAI